MTAYALQLYPQPSGAGQTRALSGLYLNHRLHRRGAPGRPFIYGNFVTSFDGRIALTGDDRQAYVPASLTTVSDWLLFQELQAQADCLVTHGGYLRALARGQLDDILQIGTTDDNDDAAASSLRRWRQDNGLPAQPAVVVISHSLNFPVPTSLKTHRQAFYIVTTTAADRTRVKLWRSKGYEVIFSGGGRWVEGEPLVAVLAELGVRSVYLQAGPLIAGALLRDGLLNRLYLTFSHQLLGGDGAFTLGTGPELSEAGRLTLESLYFDPKSECGTGQFFGCFIPHNAEP